MENRRLSLPVQSIDSFPWPTVQVGRLPELRSVRNFSRPGLPDLLTAVDHNSLINARTCLLWARPEVSLASLMHTQLFTVLECCCGHQEFVVFAHQQHGHRQSDQLYVVKVRRSCKSSGRSLLTVRWRRCNR